ncbi:hypothetical protein DJ031_18365 [bacterium endosymbiont of Escarpia laminata]|nr:MAG: hypothetical protein DJ031_18365 [bacterium endosymbiont of Escarpia laminata]
MQASETTIEAPPVRVAALGVDDRIKNSLRLFFHESCKDRFQLVEDEAADTVIIDLDHKIRGKTGTGAATASSIHTGHSNLPGSAGDRQPHKPAQTTEKTQSCKSTVTG